MYSQYIYPYPPSAACLLGVLPKIGGINVGKENRQNGSVPSEEGLTSSTGSVEPYSVQSEESVRSCSVRLFLALSNSRHRAAGLVQIGSQSDLWCFEFKAASPLELPSFPSFNFRYSQLSGYFPIIYINREFFCLLSP